MNGEATDFVPVTSVTQTATLEQMEANGSSWPDAHSNPAKMYQLANAFRHMTGISVIRVPFEITLEAQALGCALNEGKKDKTPYVKEGLSSLPETLPEDITSMGRVNVILEALDIIDKNVPDDVAVIVGVTGPFTLAGHLAGIENIVRWTKLAPDTLRDYLSLANDFLSSYIEELSKKRIDVISILEPSASTDMISPQAFEKYALPALKTMAKSTEITKVLHICGNCTPILNTMRKAGCSGLSIEAAVNVKNARRIVKEKASLVGNIDPITALLQGTPETVEKVTEEAIYGGIDVVAPGCGIAPQTPSNNLIAMREKTERITQEFQE